jgi:hypothetical protein
MAKLLNKVLPQSLQILAILGEEYFDEVNE